MEQSLQRDISASALHINTIGQFVKLTKGQKGLLSLMRTCVKEQRTFSWEELVHCYYDNVRQEYEDWKWVNHDKDNRERRWYTYDIMESYKANDYHWTYKVRANIKSWFVSTLGILVIKNQLIVIPTIDIEN
jgi:hypothetical protein